MTKTFHLTYKNGWYVLNRPLVCSAFVQAVLGEVPERDITALVSDNPIEGAAEVAVMKGGYYRWSWRFLNRASTLQGMRIATEEHLSGMFPDVPNDGTDRERKIWITIK